MPKVTVIVPNYNHARHLPQRLDSILNQTFRDFELIILDDASPDASRQVIESYLHDPRARAIFNERNSGSPFKQWNRGLQQATGEYVWIAESDDYAEPCLLETLVDRLDRHPNVGLATCQSWIIDGEGRTLHDFHEFTRIHWKHYSESELALWDRDFVANGRDYCLNHLLPFITISNASAVVFRRSSLKDANGAPGYMKLVGDLMVYADILMGSDIAFVAAPLNYFRQHVVTSRVRARARYLPELWTAHRYIKRSLGVGEQGRSLKRSLIDALPAAWELRLRLAQESVGRAVRRLSWSKRHAGI